jgi:uncharacterized membrane protein
VSIEMLATVDGYTILKTFHVLFAVIWVGGAVTANILGTRAAASGSGERLVLFGRDTEWLGTRVYFPSSLLVLLFGVLAVIRGHFGFGHAWIIVGLIGIGLTAITGSTFLGPELRRLADLAERRGSSDQEFIRRIGRLVWVARIDLLILLLVVADMVIKPGA